MKSICIIRECHSLSHLKFLSKEIGELECIGNPMGKRNCENCMENIPYHCERLKSQNRVSTELEADWQSWWSCKQLPLPINSCYEAALGLVYSELSGA